MDELRIEQTYENFLELENSDEILNFRFRTQNFPIWPFARMTVFAQYAEQQVGLTDPYTANSHVAKSTLSPFNLIKYLFRVLYSNPLIRLPSKQFPFLILNSALGNSTKRDGKYFNRVADYYASIYPQRTLMIEVSDKTRFYRPRYFRNVLHRDLIDIIAVLGGKILQTYKEDEKSVDGLLNFAKTTLKGGLDTTKIRPLLITKSKRLPLYFSMYQRLFQSIRPNLLLLEDGSYQEKAHIVAAAKSLEIPVAEMQHGMIDPYSSAYNMGTALHTNECYSQFVPDYLLTYGKFWNTQCRTPVKKIAVGNPHLSTQTQKLHPRHTSGTKTILFCSDNVSWKDFLNLLLELAPKLPPKYKIVFKPHPLEITQLENRYLPLEKFKNVKIVTDPDFYALLASCDYYVGTSSTTIFEALAFGKPIFRVNSVMGRSYITNQIGTLIQSAPHFVRLLENQKSSPSTDTTKDYWALNWEDNLRNFLKLFAPTPETTERHSPNSKAILSQTESL